MLTDRDALRAIANSMNPDEVTVGAFVGRKLSKVSHDHVRDGSPSLA